MDGDLLYPWNQTPACPNSVKVAEEFLRDGLQAPGISQPVLDDQLEVLELAEQIGIDAIDIGFPANQKSAKTVEALAMAGRGKKINMYVAARTVVGDIEPAVRLQEQCGRPIEVYAFLGSSEIRRVAENWNWEEKLQCVINAVQFAVRNGLTFAFVTEDTTRARPETLTRLFEVALGEGATRLVICDTCGAADPTGVQALYSWTTRFLDEHGYHDVLLDWHGHNDRGLALANALAAVSCGYDRIHATALGIGERAGNTATDQLLISLAMNGSYDPSKLAVLNRYVQVVSEGTKRPIPPDYPAFGEGVFRTGTGVHAAAVFKALEGGNTILADLVYSAVPASWIGRHQEFEVGPMSGAWNVRAVCSAMGITATEQVIEVVLGLAQTLDRALTPDEVRHAARKVL